LILYSLHRREHENAEDRRANHNLRATLRTHVLRGEDLYLLTHSSPPDFHPVNNQPRKLILVLYSLRNFLTVPNPSPPPHTTNHHASPVHSRQKQWYEKDLHPPHLLCTHRSIMQPLRLCRASRQWKGEMRERVEVSNASYGMRSAHQ
jgi:hypothetical protein